MAPAKALNSFRHCHRKIKKLKEAYKKAVGRNFEAKQPPLMYYHFFRGVSSIIHQEKEERN